MLKQKIRNWLKFLIKEESQEVLKEVRRLGGQMTDATLAEKSSPINQMAQRNLVATWKQSLAAGVNLPFCEVGFRNYSQFEEDGLLLYLLTAIGSPNRTFVDIGGADGINSNCANLALNHGWTGLFIDGDEQGIERGKSYYSRHSGTWAYSPDFVCAMIGRENINELIESAGFSGEVDLLSIDIDGNDYWVWDALDCITPRVVIIETHVEFGMNSIVVPYDPDYVYPGKHPQYHGASPVAMAKLARKKGYRLVGANNYGFNTIYVRDGIATDLFPEVPVESILQHPRNAERAKLFQEIKDWNYDTV